MAKRKPVSPEAAAKHDADLVLVEEFDDLLARARAAEQDLRDAQAKGASLEELHRAGKHLDSALTDVMRAAFAAQRAQIGPRGYDDRIYRRKAMATAPVRAWTMEAERLLPCGGRPYITTTLDTTGASAGAVNRRCACKIP